MQKVTEREVTIYVMLRVLALQASHTVEHGRGVNRVYRPGENRVWRMVCRLWSHEKCTNGDRYTCISHNCESGDEYVFPRVNIHSWLQVWWMQFHFAVTQALKLYF